MGREQTREKQIGLIWLWLRFEPRLGIRHRSRASIRAALRCAAGRAACGPPTPLPPAARRLPAERASDPCARPGQASNGTPPRLPANRLSTRGPSPSPPPRTRDACRAHARQRRRGAAPCAPRRTRPRMRRPRTGRAPPHAAAAPAPSDGAAVPPARGSASSGRCRCRTRRPRRPGARP